MITEENIQNIISAAQQGDRVIFNKLIDQLRCRIKELIKINIGPSFQGKMDVDDLLQETCMALWKALGKFQWQGEAAFGAWLRSLVQQAIQQRIRYLRAQKRGAAHEVRLDLQQENADDHFVALTEFLKASGASPSKAFRQTERFERLRHALRDLSPEHQKVIVLTQVKELPIKEVARCMDRSPGAVSMLLVRALIKLKEAFGTTDSFSLPDKRLGE